MLCYGMVWYVMLRYDTLCFCYVKIVLCCRILCCVVFFSIILRYGVVCCILLRYMCNVLSCIYIMSDLHGTHVMYVICVVMRLCVCGMGNVCHASKAML